jgi:hypothetical protein
MSRFEDLEKKEVDSGEGPVGALHGPMYSDTESGPNGEKIGEGVLVIDGESECLDSAPMLMRQYIKARVLSNGR